MSGGWFHYATPCLSHWVLSYAPWWKGRRFVAVSPWVLGVRWTFPLCYTLLIPAGSCLCHLLPCIIDSTFPMLWNSVRYASGCLVSGGLAHWVHATPRLFHCDVACHAWMGEFSTISPWLLGVRWTGSTMLHLAYPTGCCRMPHCVGRLCW